MLPLFLCGLLAPVLAADPAHLKPGALSTHMGRVTLVEDVLWVRYPLTALVGIPERLLAVTDQLNGALCQLQRVLASDLDISETFFKLLHARVTFLNDTLTLALADFHGFPLAHRSKRGLVDGIGQLSRSLFGTAMNNDVQELRDRYNHLFSLAVAQDKAIHLNSKHIAVLDQHLHDIASYTATLRATLNKALTSLKHVYSLAELTQALSVLEAAVHSLLRTNALVIATVVDATRGRVTDSLFPVRDLQYSK